MSIKHELVRFVCRTAYDDLKPEAPWHHQEPAAYCSRHFHSRLHSGRLPNLNRFLPLRVARKRPPSSSTAAAYRPTAALVNGVMAGPSRTR